MDTMWTFIERAANVGVILLVGLLGWRIVAPEGRTPEVSTELIHVGDRLSFADATVPKDFPAVAVVFRAECKFCLGSIEFYGSLDPEGKGRLAFLTPQGEEDTTRQVLARGGVVNPRVVGMNFNANRFLVTPLVLAADSGGFVRKVWRGKLATQDQSEVRALVAMGQ